MKNKNILTTTVLAIAGITLAASSAQANTYTPGDLLLGFRGTTGTGTSITNPTTNVVIDIGQASTYTQQGGATFTVGTFSALSTNYGPNWWSAGKLFWGVTGDATTSNAVDTLYAGGKETITGGSFVPANPANLFTPNTSSNQSAVVNKIEAFGNTFATYSSLAGAGPDGALQQGSDTNSFTSYAKNGVNSGASTDFGFFSSVAFEGVLNGAALNTTAGKKLDLFQFVPTDATSNPGTSNLEGTFTIANDGTVSYTEVAPVPEPATGSLVAGIAAVAAVIRRRRRAVAV